MKIPKQFSLIYTILISMLVVIGCNHPNREKAIFQNYLELHFHKKPTISTYYILYPSINCNICNELILNFKDTLKKSNYYVITAPVNENLFKNIPSEHMLFDKKYDVDKLILTKPKGNIIKFTSDSLLQFPITENNLNKLLYGNL
jgi:hypothetical protein